MSDSATAHVGLIVFEGITALDLVGPHEILSRVPGVRVHLVGSSLDSVRADQGLVIEPTVTRPECPRLDLLVVPGGPGVDDLLLDDDWIQFVRRVARSARFVASICTGSLVLGAAGLLAGRRATCHWLSQRHLRAFGATPSDDRVTLDGSVMTGGGVTAGIDCALRVVSELWGREAAEEVQLAVEYDPSPPFDAGHPSRARPELVDRFRSRWAARQERRSQLVAEAARRLSAHSPSHGPGE